MNILLHFIFIAAFLFIYIVAIIILKPFRLHHKRPVSTLFLKLSYLVYLACFLLFAYLILFFHAGSEISEDPSEEQVLNLFTLFSLMAFFIPNIGIMVRRSVRSWRITYNYLFSVVNLIIAAGLIYFISDMPWTFK
ncbi:MAG: hypothetical protein JXR52_05830 [Bacteroidales bacterium]|nr:hypothetical protein [Bacteroidales bacterium]MBN2698327.1 hypothetical protein [Bacteroidales bacterium]